MNNTNTSPDSKAHQKTASKQLFPFINNITDWFESVLVAIIAIIIIFTFFMRVTTVQGESMLPTLHDNEKLIVSDFLYTPAYNDVVVLQANGLINDNGEYGKPIVKRVIGLSGDKIRIDFINGVVYRNDTALPLSEQDGIIIEDGHKINSYTYLQEDMTQEVTVPDGCIFVMGDNRNNSLDSRSAMVSYVDSDYIIGRAFLRVAPFNVFGSIN